MKASEQGFSLVELLVVVAVVGILMAIGIPAYHSYVRSGQEAVAKQVLVEVAQKQVQYRVDRRGAYCCTGVTEDEAGADAMLTGLGVVLPPEARTYFRLIGFFQAYQATPSYQPAGFAFCLEPKSTAAPGTRAFRIDQAGKRTLGVDCTDGADGAKNAGAKTW